MDATSPPCNLAGLSVLVTRPAAQSDGLCDLIEQAHGRPVRYPAMQILGPADKHAARLQLAEARDAAGELIQENVKVASENVKRATTAKAA